MPKFLFAALCVSFLLGCDAKEPDTGLLNDNEAETRVMADRGLALNPAARQCHELEAVIPRGGKLEGPNCPDNKAVVNGWGEMCVAQGACNTPARRQELNAAAKSFCADWCATKKCDFAYTSRSNCDSSWCLNSRSCQNICNVPKLDTCYFQQAAANYNCGCKDPPPSPLPPVEG